MPHSPWIRKEICMYNEYEPGIGNWYHRLDNNTQFQIVALDDDEGLIEIQYFEGDVEELDRDTWQELDLEPMEAPEDWTGPMDRYEAQEYGGGGETPEESGAASSFNEDLTSRTSDEERGY